MKKLMTMIAAVATAFGLYATDFAEHTISFTGMTDGQYDLSENEGTTGLYWTYDGQAKGDYTPSDDLKVESNVLTIKTGSKVLSRKFVEDGVASLDGTNLFFQGTINFKGQALDEVPTLDSTAKFALFALDTTELVASGAGTNLYVIAAYGNGLDKKLYKLYTGGDNGLTAAWLEADHEVTIKVYDSAYSTCAGFMVYIDGTAQAPNAQVAYSMSDLDFSNQVILNNGDNYLGDVQSSVQSSLSGWVNERKLFLSLTANQTLTSVDFVGNAAITSVKLTDVQPGFIPADAEAMTVTFVGGASLTQSGISPSSVTIDGQGKITVPNGVTSFTIAPTFDKEIRTVKVGDDEVTGIEGVYAITFVKDATIEISQADAAAYVTTTDGEKTAYPTFDEAFAALADGSTLKLAKDITCGTDTTGDNLTFDNDVSITLDLAGKTISGTGVDEFDGHGVIYVGAGTLTVTNSAPELGGEVKATGDNGIALNNAEGATVVIRDGKFTGLVQNEGTGETATYTGIEASAGSFKPAPNTAIVADGFKVGTADADGFYPIVPTTYVAQIGDDKYETIEEAVAAANKAEEAATIELLADCEITKTSDTFALVFSKSATITGAFTITGPSQQYGIFVGNGATLTLAGGATITPESATSHSILTVGNLEGEEATWTTGNFVLNGGAIIGNGVGGNAIAAQQGTVTITDGVITNIGSRGVKAEIAATAVINGGIIGDLNMNKPALFCSGNGTITVNGGEINGTCNNGVTIPGTSTATFDRDQTTYCAAGWGTKLNESTSRYELCELYTITFTVGDVVETNKIFKGDVVTHADPTAPTGYSFTGWQPAIATPAAANADYVAQFTAVEYTITYTTGNGAVVTNGVTKYTIETETFALPVAADIDMSKVEGVTFDGWTNATSEAVVTQVQKGTTGNLEFFAKWKAVAPAEKDPTEDDPQQIPDTEKASERYGNKVPTTLANVSAKSIATWAQNNGKLVKGAEILENAFLLNCENTEPAINTAKANFKATSITIDSDGKVTVGTPEGTYNGTIKTLGKAELKDAEWSEDLEGKSFFELKLVPTNLE